MVTVIADHNQPPPSGSELIGSAQFNYRTGTKWRSVYSDAAGRQDGERELARLKIQASRLHSETWPIWA